MDKVCVTHHVKITTVEEDLQHMGATCIVYDNGGQDLGGVAPVQGNSPTTSGPFDDEAPVDMGTILPYETEEEKKKRQKQLGIPITKAPKSA
jgi:hypothetical protein